jgi:hypothetical protein
LRALEAQKLIALDAFAELANGPEPDRSGLRITITKDEHGVTSPNVVARLIQSLFPKTDAAEAARMAAGVDAIEITNAGALNILCRTGNNPLAIDRMEHILTEKGIDAPSALGEPSRRESGFRNYTGGFSRSGTPSGFSTTVHGRGGHSSGTSSGRG